MSDINCIKKMLLLLKPYKWTVLIIMLCLFLSSGISFLMPLINRNIMDKGFIGRDYRIIISFVLLALLLFIFDSLIGILKEKKRIKIYTNLKLNLTNQFFHHLLKLKLDYFNYSNNAEILNQLEVDVSAVSSIADEHLFFVLTKIFSMLGGIIGLCIIDYKLGLLFLVFIPVKFFVMKYFTIMRKKIYYQYIKMSKNFSMWFGDTVGGIKELHIFNIIDKKEEELFELQNDIVKSNKDINMISQWTGVIDNILVKLLQTCIYIIGAFMVFKNSLTVGSVFAFITYSAYVTDPIISILNIGYFLSGVVPSANRYFEFMSKEEENNNGIEMYEDDIGDIIFDNVSFSYNDNKKILENLNFKIPKSSKIAILGSNGVGKTSIINLILREYKVQSGEITIGGKNIELFSLKSFRDKISIVSQSIYLFNDTIRHNINLYKDISDEKMQEVIEDCGLSDLISEKTLDFLVGENGRKLSGGQRQKLAFARALIHDKPILILDEATSNADIYSEAKINNLIKTKLANKTIIIITHKTAILKNMDNILYIEKGGKGEYGSPKNLYNNKFKDILDEYTINAIRDI